MSWHAKSHNESLTELKTDEHKGLTSSEARQRLSEYGPNRLKVKPSTPFIFLFLEQFKDFMIIVLLLAAVVSGLIGEVKDAALIMIILFLNATLGATQQYRASQAIAALKKMTVPQTLVLRDGEMKKIDSFDLVPGDIVMMEAGAYVPADVRVVSAFNLSVDESALTGESAPVEKCHDKTCRIESPVADRVNMAYSGTMVTYGRGKGVVVGTGMSTELGKIAEMISQEEGSATPLQVRFAELGKWLAIISLAICAVIFLAGLLRGEKILEMFLTSVSLAVAAIPEGLPAVIAISLSLGAYRLSQKRSIIRRLPAVETLGSTTVICSDKTGTLTQNLMTVKDLFLLNKDNRKLLLTCASLCNDATGKEGDPTEKALVLAAEKEGLAKKGLELELPRIFEIPFDSQRKLMTTLHREKQGGFVAFMKGALEIVLSKTNLSEADRNVILKENERAVTAGQRVLGFAYRKLDNRPQVLEEKDFEFIGLISMIDPPRPEVKAAIEKCRQAGIKSIMITGDHKLTALAIAKEIGLAENASQVLSGEELDQLSAEELRTKVKTVKVFARVSPEHKLKIVEALKLNGEIVAMTGDGVNDGPALKRSDIGIAMGQVGTDVARESADMVLTDDNFATIVDAVEEGRGIYENIRKFIRYMLSTNSGEVFTMFLSIVFRLPLPLLPIHLLWVNLVTDGLPAVALSAEPSEKGLMQKPPRPANQSILAGGLLVSMVSVGLLMAAGTLGLFYWYLGAEGIDKARTVAFTALSLFQMAHVLNCRSLDKSLFKIGWFSNLYLVGAIALTLALQAAVVYVPFFEFVFNAVPLSLFDWGLIFLVSSTPIWIVEIRKLLEVSSHSDRQVG